MSLLQIQDLQVAFRMGKADGVVQRAQAVGRDGMGVGFDIAENRTVALVGESGSGKSVTAMSIVNLLPDNAERSGRILYRGIDLLQADAAQMRKLRGREIACVFQDPMSSLNPVLTVGRQLCEPLVAHLRMSPRAAMERAEALLVEVGMPEPPTRTSCPAASSSA
jgi:peptide/nickel transport system ATP-binding protein